MSDTITITWNTKSSLKQIRAGMDQKAAMICAKAALDWEAQAKVRAAVDTGTLKNSIQAIKITKHYWKVVVGADYGAYVEYGTVRMPAQPFFGPAGNIVRPQFLRALKGVMA